MSSLPRYRYPGIIPVHSSCKPKEKRPFTIIRPCPPMPYISDSSCRPNIFDRAVIRYSDDTKNVGFFLETFRGLILIPVNLDQFCGFNGFKDGDVVAVQAEDMSGSICDDTVCSGIPVKILTINRTWKNLIRELDGIVSVDTDADGIMYYKVTETTDLTVNDPYFRQVRNVLLFDPIVINYEIFNILGVSDVQDTLESLLGRRIKATYVDYGKETRKRNGLPIVILNFEVLE